MLRSPFFFNFDLYLAMFYLVPTTLVFVHRVTIENMGFRNIITTHNSVLLISCKKAGSMFTSTLGKYVKQLKCYLFNLFAVNHITNFFIWSQTSY